MLQQKIHNANECIRLQAVQLSDNKTPGTLDPTEDPVSELSSNGRFLYDMIQQVNPTRSSLCFSFLHLTNSLSFFSVSRVCSSSTSRSPSLRQSQTNPLAC